MPMHVVRAQLPCMSPAPWVAAPWHSVTSSRRSPRGGGPAPVRACIRELLPDILEGRIHPGRVFDRPVDLGGLPGGYRDMNDRTALKVME